MGLFQKKCIDCGSKKDVATCPFCRKSVCQKCLNRIVLKSEIPSWFVGKEVTDFTEYTKLYREYKNLFKEKGVSLHCCNDYLKSAWSGILKQVREFEKTKKARATKITLK